MPKFKLKKEEGKLAQAVNATAAAVKKKYGESNRLVDYLNRKHNEKDEYILKIFWEAKTELSMWDYIAKFQIQMPYTGMSDLRLYTNKRGKISMAHYNGTKFMGLAKEVVLTDIPGLKRPSYRSIPCVKWAVPTIDEWEINGMGKFVKRT